MAQCGGKNLYSTVMGMATVFNESPSWEESGKVWDGGENLTESASRAHVRGTHQMIRENGRSFLACVRAECSKFPYVLTGL